MKFSAAKCVWVPTPAEPKVIDFGLAFAIAMNSFSVFAGLLGLTTMACGPLATLVTATRSFSGLNGIFAYMCWLAVTMEPEVMNSV